MLTSFKIVLRNLRFHARSHLGTFLGVAVASAVLIGALAVGDSVRQSLLEMNLARLGKVDFALASQERFFREQLAKDLSDSASNTAPALLLRGTAANTDGSARANRIQVLGVDPRFWSFANKMPLWAATNAESVVLNESLAQHLHLRVGDTILIRAQKPSALPAETPLAVQEGTSQAARWPVGAIVSDTELGNFNLQASQVPPFNAFIPLKQLQSKLGLVSKANLLLVASTATVPDLNTALRRHFRLADAEAQLRPSGEGLELISDRIFLDPPLVSAALEAVPDARLISTYFVNELRVRDQSTPYSTVSSVGPPLVPAEMQDDEILINQWLAEDLQARPGDRVELKYFVLGQTRRLEEKQDSFRIRSILPLEGLAADRTLMPEFPGLAKAEKTENWDAGFPLEMNRIRAKDEQYWKDHRGTPKAFVTLKAGQKMWGNRFGDYTAIRFAEKKSNSSAHARESRNREDGILSPTLSFKEGEGAGGWNSHQAPANIETLLLKGLDPATLGFSFQPVREQALAASSQSQDFGQLFLAFSFFLILAALILVALLFQFGLETRAAEIGTYLALGFRPRQVRALLLLEGMVVALFGVLFGMFGGLVYARGILYALTTLWRSAVGTSSLHFHVYGTTMGVGVVSSLFVSAGVIWLALRNQAKRPARELLEQGAEMESSSLSKRRWAGWVAVFSSVSGLAIILNAIWQHDTANAEAFFSSGALLLVGGLSGVAVWLRRLAETNSKALTLTSLVVRGCARRRRRSLATIALLASGIFLIVAVQANKLDATRNSRERSSGTGGFAFIGETALPVVQDLNTKPGREAYGLEDLSGLDVVPMRVRDGDEASCLNLNRAQTPRLLGVKPELLQSRNAFTFSATLGKNSTPSWLLLKSPQEGDCVPAVADEASILWALGKKVGDTLDYTDEHGKKFKIKLVGALGNSILQGSLIIDEAEFVKRFPSASGYRMFLMDAPERSNVEAKLGRALQDVGLEMTPAAQRLDAFNAVQNTYLDTFQLLGALGLLLGSAGLGAVVLRNVLERRSESAVMLAVGFKTGLLRALILSEHSVLLGLGLALGMVAALIAVLPFASQVSWPWMGLSVGIILINGLLWTWVAVRLSLRGSLLGALRNE